MGEWEVGEGAHAVRIGAEGSMLHDITKYLEAGRAEYALLLVIREVQESGSLEEFSQVGVMVLLIVAADGNVVQVWESSP